MERRLNRQALSGNAGSCSYNDHNCSGIVQNYVWLCQVTLEKDLNLSAADKGLSPLKGMPRFAGFFIGYPCQMSKAF
jgi:hypothetical protein